LSPRRAATHNRNQQSRWLLQSAQDCASEVEGMMSEKIYDVSADWAKRAWVNDAKFKEMYARSVSDPKGFWGEHGKRIDWMKPFTKVENVSFAPGNISIKWFEDGVLNVAWNCIDRHLAKRGEQTAIIW
jgi:acetyl-CoA synthetase